MANKNFLFSEEGRVYLEENYVELERSTYQIAEERGTYPNMVGRALKHHGYPLRDKKNAQSAAIKNGRHPAPNPKKEPPECPNK